MFDTETTGLDPSAGDEIIQIGAVRIVNGKLLRGERFEQLVDPERPHPGSRHRDPRHPARDGRRPADASTRCCRPSTPMRADTVLVAHNAAFDMRFLQLKEAAQRRASSSSRCSTRCCCRRVVHPNQDSHRLEAIAERFGVAVVGRHTALGDALVTAEVFLKLLPLLAAIGIRTLGQAREAAEKTFHARARY